MIEAIRQLIPDAVYADPFVSLAHCLGPDLVRVYWPDGDINVYSYRWDGAHIVLHGPVHDTEDGFCPLTGSHHLLSRDLIVPTDGGTSYQWCPYCGPDHQYEPDEQLTRAVTVNVVS